MSFKFPTNPSDGEQIIMPLGNGYGHVYQYDADNNVWVIVDYTEIKTDISFGDVTTEIVATVPLNPFATPIVVDTIDDIVNLQNQREVNWAIAELALEAKNGQAVQDERIQAVELATQDLYSITDNHNTRINLNTAAIAENRLDIVELEEELEALAPSLSRGEWTYNPVGVAGVGQFTMYTLLGDITSDYNQASTIFVNPTDSTGTPHGFSDVTTGSYLEIFDSDDDDFGLYQVTDIDDQTQGQAPFWIFSVDFVKANESPNQAGGNARFKFFELADAADPTSFVAKSGDSMQGDLTMESSNIVFQPIVPDGDPDGSRPERWNYITSRRVRDANDDLVTGAASDFGVRVDLTEGRTSYNKFEFYSTVDGAPNSPFISLNGGNNPGIKFLRGGFTSSVDLKLNSDAQANGTNIVFTGSNQSGLFVNNTSKLIFDENKTYAYGRYDFQTADASDVYFQVYADSNNDYQCHVRYYGAITGDYDITNKKYVDDKFDFSKYTELT